MSELLYAWYSAKAAAYSSRSREYQLNGSEVTVTEVNSKPTPFSAWDDLEPRGMVRRYLRPAPPVALTDHAQP